MFKREHSVTERDLDQLCALFRLLSDRTRLSILMKLADGDRNVSSLCEELRLPQPTVSHHLGLLRMHNLVGNRRLGKQVYYALHAVSDNDLDAVMQFPIQKLIVQVRERGV